ncbi:MAG TPA: hypothetical protein VHD56_19185 [Tepidisphaeraceae bacterium]|nr:hypothetical protein [Tepidisphaeraceae bacterium]
MELEPSSINFKPVIDRRLHMPEPPPVRLVAIEDIVLSAGAGLEVQLDDFYVNMLRFERESAKYGLITYKAENFRLRFEIVEPPLLREDFRPLGIDVPNLPIIEQQLIDRKIEFLFQKPLLAGQESLLLQDPAGNWVQIGEIRII